MTGVKELKIFWNNTGYQNGPRGPICTTIRTSKDKSTAELVDGWLHQQGRDIHFVEIVGVKVIEHPLFAGFSKGALASLHGKASQRKAGLASAEKFSPEERSERARKAAEARWHK